jgi:hypothetical protein
MPSVKGMFGSVITIVFQSVFYSEIYQNNIKKLILNKKNLFFKKYNFNHILKQYINKQYINLTLEIHVINP